LRAQFWMTGDLGDSTIRPSAWRPRNHGASEFCQVWRSKAGRARRSPRQRSVALCRSIRPLFNFDPPATDEEIRAAALQFVRKISGFAHPSRANEAAFAAAVEEISSSASRLIASLHTNQQPRDREVEAAKARLRFAERRP
jgi:hypothetical protein